MKDSAVAPEIADPYATLEKILKVIGRSWLSEEWRLEDIRLLAQEAIAIRGSTGDRERARAVVQALQAPIRLKTPPRTLISAKRREGLSS